ncbi:amidohydrolase [Natronobeatus ordinarius]|uniref:amidohydrolase n=1 Tax=Natronobeatus ordinarius TaxID=2963433 RepID=UPI0020CBB4F4|nr:amidohydrolase [Natronobeatus ordinarius]
MNDDTLVSLRRDLHRKPEPAWREFYTTARIVEELVALDVDDLYVGRDAIAGEHRMGVPETAELEAWYERARAAGADEAVLENLEGGYTGAVAVLEQGDGPTVGLRVDIDGLPREESDDPEHVPAAEGFRSEHEGAMHACGHDAHATIGIGVLDAVRESDFTGTLKVFFQPAEEVVGGGKSMAKSEHLADVDYLLAVHVGLDHPTGEVVAGIDGFLAVSHLEATFSGESAHAGARPEEGRNAIQALATAVGNLYAIPRHADGVTRVNAGIVEGGAAANIVAEEARLVAEVRGETTELMRYMDEKARRVLESAAEMHDCDVDIETGAEAPSAESDEGLVSIVADVAGETDGIESVLERDVLGGSEDATFLMREVQENGGLACYVGVGTDHPGGHHTATFDVDEESIRHGVDTLAGAIERIGLERP